MLLLSHQVCIDKREVVDTCGMFTAMIEHIKYSFNEGKIRPTITVFRKRQQDKVPDMRVWNPLMVQFAGYNDNVSDSQQDYPSQNSIGDQGNLEFTQVTNQ